MDRYDIETDMTENERLKMFSESIDLFMNQSIINK